MSGAEARVLAVFREFGSLAAPQFAYLPEGLTLAQMRQRMRTLPADFDARGVICVNGHRVVRSAWPLIRPKASHNGLPVEITFHAPPLGGGNDGGKNVFALVASIALTALTGFVAGGGLAAKLGFSAKLFGAGTIGATAASAVVAYGGSLLLSSLVPPPVLPGGAKAVQNPGAASASGNVLEPNGPVPRVIGERKAFPPLACEPVTYFDGEDEVVEAVYLMAGPHRLRDVRIGTAEIGSLTDVEYELREGWPGDAPIEMVTRQARTEQVQNELRGHAVSADDGVTLETVTGNTASALPQAMTVGTRDAPDEHWLHIVFPGGLHRNASDTDRMRVPFRLRLRPAGGAWVDLPELHFAAASVRQIRASIRLLWRADATTSPAAATTEGWVEARVTTPAQTLAPAQPGFAAAAYFDDGAGDAWMNASNLGSTRVDHVILSRSSADIYLDAAVFPPGRYEIEVRRGAAVRVTDYASAAYTVAGAVYDLFAYSGTPARVPQSRNGVSDQVYLLRSVSVWNEHPLPTDDFAVIAVRARNRQLAELSCIAGGYVPDWDGVAWTGAVVTDNPAPHLRDILTGRENLDPVPAAILDDAGLVAWRNACAGLGYRCNALIEDASVEEAARIVAACGYAKPYMSDVWGVVRDYDRSAEAPVQIFTPRNASGFRMEKAFARVPDGFRVNFRDAAQDYDARQITVYRAGVSDDTGRLEQVTYEGLVAEAEVQARAVYDLAQADRRSAFWSWEAPAEAIVCRRGSLVGVQHDALSEYAAYARVTDVVLDAGGAVTGLRLDAAVPVVNEPDVKAVTDMKAVADVKRLGQATGALIRRDGSRTTHAVTNATGETDLITFSPAIAATGIAPETLVTIGPAGGEVRRLIVFDMIPRDDLTWTVVAVDEAAGLLPADPAEGFAVEGGVWVDANAWDDGATWSDT